MAEPLHIGILIYPNVTQLDAPGPRRCWRACPGAVLHMIWKTRDPIPTDAGFSIVPNTTFADCPKLDVICVPRRRRPGRADERSRDARLPAPAGGEPARYVTSVCTGSLVLGAAGLLKAIARPATGRGATC